MNKRQLNRLERDRQVRHRFNTELNKLSVGPLHARVTIAIHATADAFFLAPNTIKLIIKQQGTYANS